MTLGARLDEATRTVAPTIACVIQRDGVVVHDSVHGALPDGTALAADAEFALASLTKLATTATFALAIGHRVVKLDDPVGDILPNTAWPTVTLRELLGHRAGLTPWAPWFDLTRTDPRTAGLWPGHDGGRDHAHARATVLHAVLHTPRDPTRGRAYSDAGFIALGEHLARGAGRPLDHVVEAVLARLGADLHYRRVGGPVPTPPPPVVPTGQCRPRAPAPGQEGEYEVGPAHEAPGEVDDEHAWILGGVAGHAGLFGTARAVAQLGEALRQEVDGAGRLAPPDLWRELIAPDAPQLTPVRALGFDLPAPTGSCVGERFGRGRRGAIGHLGFTGTSLWIDLDRRLVVALLTNRVWRSRTETAGIRALRRAVHDAAVDLA